LRAKRGNPLDIIQVMMEIATGLHFTKTESVKEVALAMTDEIFD
jgi:hypothetical protein